MAQFGPWISWLHSEQLNVFVMVVIFVWCWFKRVDLFGLSVFVINYLVSACVVVDIIMNSGDVKEELLGVSGVESVRVEGDGSDVQYRVKLELGVDEARVERHIKEDLGLFREDYFEDGDGQVILRVA